MLLTSEPCYGLLKTTVSGEIFCFLILRNTVMSSNKETLKICEIGQNKGTFPLLIRFSYLKNFDQIPLKSLKPRTETGFSDHSRQI